MIQMMNRRKNWDDMFESQQIKDKKKMQETDCDRQKQTKLAQSASQYYFVLQSSHKVRPSTTSYHTKYFPVLLRTTKLAQSTSQYYFVLQSSHKVRPSTTSYYKARTKHFPVLLRTTKLAQSTSQYYTSYYKACTKYFKIANLPQFLTINLISCERVATDGQLEIFPSFDDRTSFRAKGLRPTA